MKKNTSKPKRGDIITIVDNLTGEEATGVITEYTPETIALENYYNAKKVHFKEESGL